MSHQDESMNFHHLRSGLDVRHVGLRMKTISVGKEVLNPSDPQIKSDILQMILQYLNNEGYTQSHMILQDEANVKNVENRAQETHVGLCVVICCCDVEHSC
eukprot:Sdes_comp20650_c0_seq2m15933